VERGLPHHRPFAVAPILRKGGFGLLTGMHMASLVSEFWQFLRVRKKWWLLPIVVVMVLVGALLVFAQGSALAPFIYTIF